MKIVSPALTRVVLRRILNNEAISHRDLSNASRWIRPGCHNRSATVIHKRTIFGLLSSSVAKTASLSREDVSFSKHSKALEEAHMLLTVNYRTAPKKQLAASLMAFFKEAEAAGELITDHHATVILPVIDFLTTDDSDGAAVGIDDARFILECIEKFDHGRSNTTAPPNNVPFDSSYQMLVMKLVRFIAKSEVQVDDVDMRKKQVRCLANAGATQTAAALISGDDDIEIWSALLGALRSTGNREEIAAQWRRVVTQHDVIKSELLHCFALALAQVRLNNELQQAIMHPKFLVDSTTFLALSARLLTTIEASDNQDSPTAELLIARVESFLVQAQKLSVSPEDISAWFDAYLLHVTARQPIDNIKAMVSNLDGRHGYAVNIDSINRLLERAYGADQPAAAMDITALSEDMKISLNAYSFLPQMHHQIATGAIKHAIETWDHILYDLEPLDAKTMARNMEILLQAVLASDSQEDDTLHELLDNLPKYARRLSTESLVAVVRYYLVSGTYQDASNLMIKHAPYLTKQARNTTVHALVRICLDEETPVEAVWHAYSTIKTFFNETPREPRELIMNVFGRRGALNSSMQVFLHMTEHWRQDIKPVENTYLMALDNLKESPKGVATLFNLLKIDLNVEPSTRLWNALIRAVTKSELTNHRSPVEFWNELVVMEEGPNEESVLAVLAACRAVPMPGQAEAVWATVEDHNIEITERTLAAYVSNLLLWDKPDQAKSVLETTVMSEQLDKTKVLHEIFQTEEDIGRQFALSSWIEQHFTDFSHSGEGKAMQERLSLGDESTVIARKAQEVREYVQRESNGHGV